MFPSRSPTRSSKPSAARRRLALKCSLLIPMLATGPISAISIPDSYAVRRLGHSAMWSVTVFTRNPPRSNCNATPEALPGNCKVAIRLAEVLVVISLNLLDPVLDAMQQPQAEPVGARAPRRDSGVEPASGLSGGDLVEFPFFSRFMRPGVMAFDR